MKKGFTGTRHGMTECQKLEVESQLRDCTEFHHGDCVGADAEAHDIAERLGIKIVIHPPSSPARRAFKRSPDIRKPKPYLDRNKDIVIETELLIAAPDRAEHLRSGTWSTVRYARKLGRQVFIVLPDGSWYYETYEKAGTP